MGKTHKEQIELKQELERAQKRVEIGARYVHYKGPDKVYRVIGLAFMEADNEICVVYQSQNEEQLTFIRPLSIWLEKVDWHGRRVQRFARLDG